MDYHQFNFILQLNECQDYIHQEGEKVMEKVFSVRFRNLIHKKNLEISKVAEALGLNIKTIYAFMNGTRFPSSRKLIEIANFLEVSVDYLIGKTDDPTGILLREDEEDIKEEILYIRRAYKEMSKREKQIIMDLIKSIERSRKESED